MRETRIRPARAADAEAITELVHASSAYQGSYASILDGYAVSGAQVEATVTFVAEDDVGAVVGCYSLVPGNAELDLLFVADAAQGTGLGARLVQHMLERARDLGLREVRVVSHPPAEGFYLRTGARRVGVVPAKPPKVPYERPELRWNLVADRTGSVFV
ncbi:GNAT family N-acetyltransferase [Allokutzneria sp. A3M-2-11 16]|uniref:GNAT family N-acetyltransferase n=1 Tax=Allokutzneria sp. A3M-2-11 16 TaxID=2962043 RepID=UPI0020B8EBA1|nr:GNAT family N-acetyltransferase [Allokutzneria sp. A3M-2-11 16]MCP3803639.1 GNAT family N-acetyltransferase [Allokutzneria sp. A3M-2-11 16]